jgi:hypothetical protein
VASIGIGNGIMGPIKIIWNGQCLNDWMCTSSVAWTIITICWIHHLTITNPILHMSSWHITSSICQDYGRLGCGTMCFGRLVLVSWRNLLFLFLKWKTRFSTISQWNFFVIGINMKIWTRNSMLPSG